MKNLYNKSIFAILIFVCLLSTAKLAAQFTRLYGASTNESFTKVIQNGTNYYCLGRWLDPATNQSKATITKMNSTGQHISTLALNIASEFTDAVLTPSGDLIVVGYTAPLNSSSQSIMGKFTTGGTGSFSFVRSYDVPGRDFFNRIAKSPLGGNFPYYIVGAQNDPSNPSATWDDVVLLNVNETGGINWKRKFTSNEDDEFFRDLEILANGDLIIAGVSGNRGVIVRLDANGITINAGTPDNLIFSYTDISQLGNSGFYAVGETSPNFIPYIIRYDNDFLPQWHFSITGLTDINQVWNNPANGRIFVTGTGVFNGKSRAVLIRLFEVTSSNVLIEWVRFLDNGETSYSGGSYWFLSPNQIGFTDGRVPTLNGFGNTDAFLHLNNMELLSCMTKNVNLSLQARSHIYNSPEIISTFFDIPRGVNILSSSLNWDSQDACKLPCNAVFTYQNTNNCGNIQFNNQSTGALPLSYAWTFGDPSSGTSNTSTSANPTHQYRLCDTYNVCLIITANDQCRDTFCQTVTFNDNIKPVITCPPNLTMSCNGNTNPTATGTATATDNCMNTAPLLISYSDVTSGNIPCDGTIGRTWTATDACGNASNCLQLINIKDNVPPVIVCPTGLTLQCNANTNPAFTGVASATDNCTPTASINISFTDHQTGNISCNEIIRRTWSATDACKNISTCVQVIRINDTTRPTIYCPADRVLQCNILNPPPTGFATATDNCALTSNITLSSLDVLTGQAPCNRTITRTWTAQDDCKNKATCVQIIKMVDTIPPDISCPRFPTVNTNPGLCYFTGTYPSAVATDSCDSNPTIVCSLITPTSSILITPNTQYPKGINTITCYAIDLCGNQSKNCTFTLTVQDKEAPEISCPVSISVLGTYNNAGQCKAVVNNIPPIVSDNCPMTTVAYTFTGATTGQGIADASGSTFMFGTTTVQYVATDMAGNQDTCKFNVKVFCEDTCCDDMQNNIANGHFLGQATGNLTPSSLPWYAAYLTPQIGTGDSCETPRVGQMWGNSVVGEVMGQTMPGLFKNGWTYRISFCAKFININNLPPNLQHGWFNLEAENGPYTGNGATIGQSPILNQHDVWSHVCLPDWKPTADYNSLFINFQNSSTTNHGDSVSWGRIDDICIQVVDSGCCTDSSQFASLINQGFTIVQTNCKVTVSAPQFDTCYFFSSPPSLDGSLVPQIITNANDMWMYNFTQSGIHQVCVTVFDDCNSRQMCTRFEVECDTCYCGSFSNISARLTGGAQNQSITCGDTIPLNCPQVFQLGGDFNCKGNDCDTTTKLDWKLEGPINTSGSISINTGFTLPLTASAFAASGLYTLTLTGYCDGKECPPCIIYFNATACDSTWACPCDNMTFNSELVRNGHFSLGNDGSFSNDYTYYNAGTSTSIGGYSVVTNAQVPLANSQWACNDHTTGTGQFLIVDGASNSGGIAWEQMIPGSDSGSFNLCFYANNLVIPAKDYEDPIIGVFINGVQVIPNFTISEIPDLWIPFNVTWVGKLPAKIEIHTQTSAVVGNDFAIDDISFTKCSSYDTSPCDSLNTGLVGYFPFVNNVDDASPTLGHGNLIGNPVPNLTFGKDGVANSAYHFNGSGQYIQAGFTDRNTTNQVTVMAWVKTTSKNPQWIAGKYEFNQDRGYGLTIGNNLNGSSGYVAFGGRDGTQTYHTSGFSKDSVNDGQWHCITGVAGQGYWKVYIDGILQSSTVGSSNNIASGPTIPFTIGAFTGTNPGTPLLMHGDIDDVKIYNRVISPTEIECLCAGSEEFGVCRCGAFSNLFYRIGGAQNQNLECSKTFTLTCPKVFQFGGEFACQGNDCDSTTKVEWTINGPIAGGGTVLANQGFTLPLNAQSFSLDGLYTLTLTGYCDGKPCPPCIINFEVTGCSPCCKDSIAFYNAVANFQTNSALGNCTIIANGTGLDSCKQVTWTWGDGNTTGPVANASPVSHIYSGTGTYNVCYIIEELDDDGEVCWSHKKCDSIFIACGDCDSVSLYVIPSGQNGDTCCYKVFINNINGPLITNINISAPTPVNFIGANPAPGWQVGPGPSLLQWALASGGTVPSGNNIQMGTFCLKASGEFPQNFTVQFLEFVGPNKFNLHCVDTLRTECVADSCVCGSFIDLSARINVGQQNIAIECGKSYLLDCPPVFQFGGDFICHGNDCDSVTKVSWFQSAINRS